MPPAAPSIERKLTYRQLGTKGRKAHNAFHTYGAALVRVIVLVLVLGNRGTGEHEHEDDDED